MFNQFDGSTWSPVSISLLCYSIVSYKYCTWDLATFVAIQKNTLKYIYQNSSFLKLLFNSQNRFFFFFYQNRTFSEHLLKIVTFSNHLVKMVTFNHHVKKIVTFINQWKKKWFGGNHAIRQRLLKNAHFFFIK